MLLTTFCVLCLTASTYAEILSPDFAAQLLVKAVQNNKNDNIIASPYSLLGPLGALTVGSGYTTRGEILDVLGLSNKTNVLKLYDEYKKQLSKLDGVKLSTANKIYVDDREEINHRFNSVAKKNFDLQLEYIDFNQTKKAEQAINHWVQNNTHKNFTLDLHPNPQLRAVLVNTVSLNAPWRNKFVQERDFDIFYVSKSENITVEYIRFLSLWVNYTDSEELNARVVSVPLKDETCQLVIVAPNKRAPVESVLKVLNDDSDVVNRALPNIKTKNSILVIPNLDVDTTTDLKRVLQEMGVERAFEDNAQIRRTLRNNSELFLDEARQKTHFLVNTEGIQGAAVNDVKISTQSADVVAQFPPLVKVNSPFYIEVRCSNIVLFNGIIRRPHPIYKGKGLGQCCGGH